MRVMIVASKYLPEYTGAAFRIHKLYQSFGCDITAEVVCGGIERKKAEIYNIDKIKITRLQDFSSGMSNKIFWIFSFYVDFFRTYFYLKKQSFDILHIVGTSAQTIAAYYYAFFYQKPIVIELVTRGARPVSKLPVIGKIWSAKFTNRSVFVAISEPLGKACYHDGFSGNVWVRPNPVDVKKFFPREGKKNELRIENNLFEKEDIVLSMIAKFMPQKNQIFMLDVLFLLPQKYKLVLAGPVVTEGSLAQRDQKYIAVLENKIQTLGLISRVIIIKGFVHNPQDIISASDMYVMPNMQEGLGTPLLEAQACAVPVIANKDEEAFLPYIFHEEDGFLASLDHQAWADCIMRYKNLNQSAIQKRAEDVLNQYNFSSVKNAYERIFSALLQAKESDVINLEGIVNV